MAGPARRRTCRSANPPQPGFSSFCVVLYRGLRLPHAPRGATGPFRRFARPEIVARAAARALRFRLPALVRGGGRHRRAERDSERLPVALAAARADRLLADPDAGARVL